MTIVSILPDSPAIAVRAASISALTSTDSIGRVVSAGAVVEDSIGVPAVFADDKTAGTAVEDSIGGSLTLLGVTERDP